MGFLDNLLNGLTGGALTLRDNLSGAKKLADRDGPQQKSIRISTRPVREFPQRQQLRDQAHQFQFMKPMESLGYGVSGLQNSEYVPQQLNEMPYGGTMNPMRGGFGGPTNARSLYPQGRTNPMGWTPGYVQDIYPGGQLQQEQGNYYPNLYEDFTLRVR